MKKVRKMCVSSMLTSVLALSAVWLSSCSHDEFPVDKPMVAGEKGTLSFVLPLGGKKSVTYAAGDPTGNTVAASTAEKELKNLLIYWFKNDTQAGEYTLLQTFEWTPQNSNEIALENADDNTKRAATIAVGQETGEGHFYIIANVNAGNSTITSKKLYPIAPGVTESTFEAYLSDELGTETNGDMKLLSAPIAMSNKLDGSGNKYITVSNVENGGDYTATLKRRVVRFDIVNQYEFSNFKLKQVIVTNANTQGFLLDDDAMSQISGKGKAVIDVETTANGKDLSGADLSATSGGKIPDIFLDGTEDSTYINESVFYLYPTQLGDETTPSNTQINIYGSYKDMSPRMFKLDLGGNPLSINANKVYRLYINRMDEHDLTFKVLEIADWDETDSIPTVQVDTKIKVLSAESTGGTDWVQDGTAVFEYSVGSSNNPDSVLVTIKTEGTVLGGQGNTSYIKLVPEGTEGVDYVASDAALLDVTQLVESETVLTYGAVWTTTHKIKLPATTAPMKIKIHVESRANSQDYVEYHAYSNNYNKLGYKTVKVGNMLWAPVNVGASVLAEQKKAFTQTDTATIGFYYQWGRNTAFSGANGIPTTSTPFTSVDEANSSNKFFITIDNPWLSSMEYDLWSGDKTTPCPEGWRLPTKEDAEALLLLPHAQVSGVPWIKLTGNDRDLFIPAASYRNADTNGNVGDWGGNYYYLWTSSVSGSTISRFYGHISGTMMIGSSASPNYGFQIRAVREIPTQP
jgi:uncharacterized protein (TIGR02145 family)